MPRSYPHHVLWHWIAFSPLWLKIGAECIYLCTNSPNYRIWLVQSSNWHWSWFCIENWCWMHIHTYQFPELPNLVIPITKLTSQLVPHWKLVLNAYTYVPVPRIAKFGYSNHQIDITVEFTLKNGAKCIYICTNSLNYQIWLVRSSNSHHGWIHIEKWCWMHIHMYQFPKLPNLVSPITKLTSRLNSHRKTGPGHI